MQTDSSRRVRPAKGFGGVVRLPGDKSISHRYAMLGAIAEGTTRLTNFSTGADCASTLGCLWALGVRWDRGEAGTLEIHGRGPELAAPADTLDCGNSGSTMRMLSGILAGQRFACELSGDESLRRRPMERMIAPLQAMGAKIESAPGGRPPLGITGARLRGVEYRMPIASAQVKTALLFAGLAAEGETRVEEPVQTRDHGEQALEAFGAELEREGRSVSIRGGQRLHAIEAAIPGDISSAAFFMCAAALFRGSRVTFPGVLLNPTRARLLDMLTLLGARISIQQVEEHHGELVGTVLVEGNELRGLMLQGADTAALIDEVPVLAAIAPYTRDGLEVRDARELRVKESDRIAAVAENLRAMGAAVTERDAGLWVPGGQQLNGAKIDARGDHRVAMAFAVAALRAEGESTIEGADAAAISYPEFFAVLDELAQR